jgi:hypothetical protein
MSREKFAMETSSGPLTEEDLDQDPPPIPLEKSHPRYSQETMSDLEEVLDLLRTEVS